MTLSKKSNMPKAKAKAITRTTCPDGELRWFRAKLRATIEICEPSPFSGAPEEHDWQELDADLYSLSDFTAEELRVIANLMEGK